MKRPLASKEPAYLEAMRLSAERRAREEEETVTRLLESPDRFESTYSAAPAQEPPTLEGIKSAVDEVKRIQRESWVASLAEIYGLGRDLSGPLPRGWGIAQIGTCEDCRRLAIVDHHACVQLQPGLAPGAIGIALEDSRQLCDACATACKVTVPMIRCGRCRARRPDQGSLAAGWRFMARGGGTIVRCYGCDGRP